jgi:DNA-binding CsgD family transcriptional regulator
MLERRRTLERKATALTALVALQTLAAVFFVTDAASDIRNEGLGPHIYVEAAAALALLAGVLLGAWQVRELVLSARRDEAAVTTARGALADLMQQRFADWHLTAAEADVALFALKGFDIAEIARMRAAAQGTVRAQLARVYAKSGSNSQAGLTALFIDELIEPPGD